MRPERRHSEELQKHKDDENRYVELFVSEHEKEDKKDASSIRAREGRSVLRIRNGGKRFLYFGR
jgi:hypothetical protein